MPMNFAKPRHGGRALILLLIAFSPCSVPAQAAPDEKKTLIVGTKQAAPFSFRSEEGSWEGISIDLWKQIASDLGLEYEFREFTLDDLVAGLGDDRIDVSVAALTVTSEREQVVDFTHPFHSSGLGIALPPEKAKGLLSILRALISLRFLQATATLILLIFIAGAILWLLERKKNREQFGGSLARGLGQAFWWSAVTMTTVGYGDKSPQTPIGRFFAVIWMFASIITISGLTAAIASTLTVSKLEASVRGPQDLPSIPKVVCVSGTTGEEYLKSRRILFIATESAAEAVDGVANGRFGAAVYDAPILRYLATTSHDTKISVPPVTFERQDYSFGLPLDSKLRKPINKALVKRISSPEWDSVLFKYLGSVPPGN